jgi:hypothetical protein
MDVILKKPKFNIYVKIMGYKLCEENYFPYSKFFEYVIRVCTNNKKWDVYRRYKNFNELHKILEKKISNLPKLPKKKIFISEKVIKEREQKLQKYLNTLLAREDVYKFNEIFEFIEMEKENYLMLKDNIEEENSLWEDSTQSSESDKLKKSKSFEVFINENFFYSENSHKYNHNNDNKFKEEKFTEKAENPNSMRSYIKSFIKEINLNTKNKCQIIKNFEIKFNDKKMNHVFQRDEIYKLLFGDTIEGVHLGGLVYHTGMIRDNQIGAEMCLEFLSKLLDFEYNVDCDFFITIMKIAKLNQILEMNLEEHLKSKKKNVTVSCFKIIKAIISEEKGIYPAAIIKDEKLIDNFNFWINEY